jgi:hypothetical protein
MGAAYFLGALYFFSMCVAPWLISGWSWAYVQKVWWNWQSLNVGVIALASSLIALKVVAYRESKQRKRDFVAARAFLPHALSELCSYFKDCADVLLEALNNVSSNEPEPIGLKIPVSPAEYRLVFSKCIAFAESDVAEYLARLVNKLQVHQSRLQGVSDDLSKRHGRVLQRANFLEYLKCLAEMQAMVNNIFGFSRGEGVIDFGVLAWPEYRTAYFNLGHLLDKLPELERYAKKP